MPRTVIAPTLRKSCASVSWTSANCAVGPPMWPDAAGPNVAAPSARVDPGVLDDLERAPGVRRVGRREVEARRRAVLGHEGIDRVLELLGVVAGQRGREVEVVGAGREHRRQRREPVRQRVEGVLGLLLELLGGRRAGQALRGERGVRLAVEVVGETVERTGQRQRVRDRCVLLERRGGLDAVLVGVERLDLGEGRAELREVVAHQRGVRVVLGAPRGCGRRGRDGRGQRAQLGGHDALLLHAVDDVDRVLQAIPGLAPRDAAGRIGERHGEAVHVVQGLVEPVPDLGVQEAGVVRALRRAVVAREAVGHLLERSSTAGSRPGRRCRRPGSRCWWWWRCRRRPGGPPSGRGASRAGPAPGCRRHRRGR